MRRNRFEPALLADLLRAAGKTVRLEGDDVVIAHAYVLCSIRPLSISLPTPTPTRAQPPLAITARPSRNPGGVEHFSGGDVLTKNFGVTRRGRVAFYDYDELCFLTDCNFRDLPQASTYEEEIAAEPWFSVRENDVFPEEFPNFLHLPGPTRAALLEQHADLFHPDFRPARNGSFDRPDSGSISRSAERRLVTAN